jgi:hypothetical protein
VILSAAEKTGFDQWAADYRLTGDDALSSADPDEDGMDNLREYAFGGDPNADDAAALQPVLMAVNEDGTDWYYYIQRRRTDDESLSYVVMLADDLVNAAAAMPNAPIGQSAEVDGFTTFTNRTDLNDHAFFTITVMRNHLPLELLNSSYIPPQLITEPFPAYAEEFLPFAMNAGSIEVTPGGRLWSCWIGGEDGPNAFLTASYSDDRGQTWRDPVLVIDPRPLSMGTHIGCFWCDPLGRLWLFFTQSPGMFDGRNGNWFTRCDDPDADEPVWTEPGYIGFGASIKKPIARKNGEWILPVSLWERWHISRPFQDCYHELDPVRGANVFVSDDQGGHWRYRGGIIYTNSSFNEQSVVELEDGRLWMLSRCIHEAAQSFSDDGGKTWSVQETAFPHVNAMSVIRRLASGNILLVKHGTGITSEPSGVRDNLTAFLTTDEGETWSPGLLLDERKAVSYPDIAQTPDGDIYVQYDYQRSRAAEILFARFREEDVEAGKFTTGTASSRNVIKDINGMRQDK